jgi:hypothetical protein
VIQHRTSEAGGDPRRTGHGQYWNAPTMVLSCVVRLDLLRAGIRGVFVKSAERESRMISADRVSRPGKKIRPQL